MPPHSTRPHRLASTPFLSTVSVISLAALVAGVGGLPIARHPVGVGAALAAIATVGFVVRRRIAAAAGLDRAHDEARTDELTGLANRRALIEQLDRSGRDDPAEDRALVLVDLDGFKDVNDSMGHRCGDTVLRSLSDRLKGLEQRFGADVFRLGGDEFAFLLTGTNLGAADRLADEVIAIVEQPFVLGDRTFLLGASVGIADGDRDDASGDRLLDTADQAMYAAKRHHRTVSRLDTSENDSHDRLGLSTSARLVDLVEDIEIRCQPIVSARTDAVVGVEALARYQAHGRPTVPVGEFVAAVHRVGRLCELTDAMLAKSLDWGAAWNDAGHPLSVSVNISIGDLLDERFEKRVLTAVEARRLPPHLLTLEMAMSSLDGHLTVGEATLDRLRREGVRISLDDFGTGHANLARFAELEFDEIKMDRRFTAQALDNPRARAAIRSAVDMAHEVGATVVAEGVEDSETCDLMRHVGADLLQGYYLGVPIRPEELRPERSVETFAALATLDRP